MSRSPRHARGLAALACIYAGPALPATAAAGTRRPHGGLGRDALARIDRRDFFGLGCEQPTRRAGMAAAAGELVVQRAKGHIDPPPEP